LLRRRDKREEREKRERIDLIDFNCKKRERERVRKGEEKQ